MLLASLAVLNETFSMIFKDCDTMFKMDFGQNVDFCNSVNYTNNNGIDAGKIRQS